MPRPPFCFNLAVLSFRLLGEFFGLYLQLMNTFFGEVHQAIQCILFLFSTIKCLTPKLPNCSFIGCPPALPEDSNTYVCVFKLFFCLPR